MRTSLTFQGKRKGQASTVGKLGNGNRDQRHPGGCPGGMRNAQLLKRTPRQAEPGRHWRWSRCQTLDLPHGPEHPAFFRPDRPFYFCILKSIHGKGCWVWFLFGFVFKLLTDWNSPQVISPLNDEFKEWKNRCLSAEKLINTLHGTQISASKWKSYLFISPTVDIWVLSLVCVCVQKRVQ